jgi:hypothetical protein
MQKAIAKERPDLTFSSTIQETGGGRSNDNRSFTTTIPKGLCKLLQVRRGDTVSWNLLSFKDNTLTMKIVHTQEGDST